MAAPPLAIGGVLLTVVTFWLQGFIASQFRQAEQRQQARFDSQVQLMTNISESILRERVSIYAEISEITYRLRNYVRDHTDEDLPHKWGPEFSQLVDHFSDNLFKYRAFLEEAMFSRLHDLRNELQWIKQALVKAASVENPLDVAAFAATRSAIAAKQDTIQRSSDEILRGVRSKIDSFATGKLSKP